MLRLLRKGLDWIVGLLLRNRAIVMSVIRQLVGNSESLRELMNRKKAIADFGSDPTFISNLLKEAKAFDQIADAIAGNPEALQKLLNRPDTLKHIGAQAAFIDAIAADDRVVTRLVAGRGFVAGLTRMAEKETNTPIARLMRTPEVFEAVVGFLTRSQETLIHVLMSPAVSKAVPGQAEFISVLAGNPKVIPRIVVDKGFCDGLLFADPEQQTPSQLSRLLNVPAIFEATLAHIVDNPEFLSRLLTSPNVLARLDAHPEFLRLFGSRPLLLRRLLESPQAAATLSEAGDEDATATVDRLAALPIVVNRAVAHAVTDEVRFDALLRGSVLLSALARRSDVVMRLLELDGVFGRMAAKPEFMSLLEREAAGDRVVANFASDTYFVVRLMQRAWPRLLDPPADLAARAHEILASLFEHRLTEGGWEALAELVLRRPVLLRRLFADPRLRDRVAEASIEEGFGSVFALHLANPAMGLDVGARALRLLGDAFAQPAFLRALARDDGFRLEFERLAFRLVRDVDGDLLHDLSGDLAEEATRSPGSVVGWMLELPGPAERRRLENAVDVGRDVAAIAEWVEPEAFERGRSLIVRPRSEVDFGRFVGSLVRDGRLALRGARFEVCATTAALEETFVDLFLEETCHLDEEVRDIIDGAAGSGLSPWYLKTRHPGARIRAFEPDPDRHAAARANLAGLDLAGVELRNAVLGGENGRSQIRVGGGTSVEVDRVALADLVDGPIDLVRLTGEGPTFDAILGLGDELRNIHYLHVTVDGRGLGSQARLGELIAHLTGHGFEFHLRRVETADVRSAARPLTAFGRAVTYAVAARNTGWPNGEVVS